MSENASNTQAITEESDDMEIKIEGLAKPQPLQEKTTAQLVEEISADIEAHFNSQKK